MARGKCKDQPPDLFFPSDGVGVEVAAPNLRGLPGEVSLPGVRHDEPHRPRRMGRNVRARAPSYRPPPPAGGFGFDLSQLANGAGYSGGRRQRPSP